MERLQKIIAQAGVCSRRKAEELITLGKVSVNGVVVKELGCKASSKDIITVNGKVLAKEPKQYIVMNKPQGVVTSVKDPQNRTTVIDILPDEFKKYRLFPVGRLDYDTKGIIILTNDGELMNELVGPRSGVEKEYMVRIKGIMTNGDLKKLCEGVMIEGKLTLPAIASIIEFDKIHKSTLLTITITEGRYHQVKEMFKALGYEVKKLIRTRFGHLTIDNIRAGEVKRLSIKDVRILHELAKKDKVLNPFEEGDN